MFGDGNGGSRIQGYNVTVTTDVSVFRQNLMPTILITDRMSSIESGSFCFTVRAWSGSLQRGT